MVANMETIEPTPDPHEASESLDAIADAQRAIRDRPWPGWLYPANALLLGGMALAGLIDSSMIAAFVVLALGVGLVALNYGIGRLLGAPFAVPTSRAFRVLVAVSALFVIASVPARAAGLEWAVIGCAAAAVVSYGIGAVLHSRSTRR